MMTLIDNSEEHDKHAERKSQLKKVLRTVTAETERAPLTDTERKMRQEALGAHRENRRKL